VNIPAHIKVAPAARLLAPAR